MKKLCCETAKQYVIGSPGHWKMTHTEVEIVYCPFCSKKLPFTDISKFEVIVRFNRGLGPEFKKINVDAVTIKEAKEKGEKEAERILSAEKKLEFLGSQVTLIKEE